MKRKNRTGRRAARVVGPLSTAVLGLTVMLGCSKQPDKSSAAGTSTASTPSAATPQGVAPWAGTVIRGRDRMALKSYLEHAPEVTPTTFRVEWNPATVAFDRAAAIRALRSVTANGSRFTLDPGEPAVARLKPGSILWIWDVTLSKVERVEQRGGSTVVYTRPVALNEAIVNGEIAFETPVHVDNFLLHRSPPAAAKHAARTLSHASPFRYASFIASEMIPDQGEAEAEEQADDEEEQADADQAAFVGNAFNGELKGYQYTIGYAPSADGSLKLLLEARDGEDKGGGGGEAAPSDELQDKFKELRAEQKSLRDEIRELRTKMEKMNAEGPEFAESRRILDAALLKRTQLADRRKALEPARTAAKKLFETISENLDVRFRMAVDMKGFTAAGNYLFKDGNVENASLQFKQLNGRAKVSFVGRLGDKDSRGTKIPLLDIPIAFNVPMPIGGIPFVLQVGADFLINVFLAGQHATLSVDGEYAFNGSSGFTYSKTNADYTSTFGSAQPNITGHQGQTPGASAVVLGIQLPRIGYGLGLMGISSVAYFDVVHVLTMTSGSSASIGLMPPCQRMTYAAAGHVGIQTDVLPIPIAAIQDAAKNKLSPKKEIFKVERELLDPPIKGCEIGGK